VRLQLEAVEEVADEAELKGIITEFARDTGSAVASALLRDWDASRRLFVKATLSDIPQDALPPPFSPLTPASTLRTHAQMRTGRTGVHPQPCDAAEAALPRCALASHPEPTAPARSTHRPAAAAAAHTARTHVQVMPTDLKRVLLELRLESVAPAKVQAAA
jgi:glutamate synthase domain-containing protein 3